MAIEETPVEVEEEAGEEGEEVAELDEDMQAAIAAGGEAQGSPQEEEDDEDHHGVAEHLKEAVEGSFRMKRLLERDDEDPEKKKARLATPEGTLVKKLLSKWVMADDLVSKYVLDELNIEELKFLDSSGYVPDKFHWQKSAGFISLGDPVI